MFFDKIQQQTVTAMSILYSTFFITKFKSFFFIPLSFSGWFIVWPKGISYAAWQNLLKSYLCFIGLHGHSPLRKSKSKRKLSRRYRKFLQEKIQTNEIVQEQTETIVNQLETVEPIKHDDIKIVHAV